MPKYLYIFAHQTESRDRRDSLLIDTETGGLLTVTKKLNSGGYGDVRVFSGACINPVVVKKYKRQGNRGISIGSPAWERHMTGRVEGQSYVQIFQQSKRTDSRLVIPYYNMSSLGELIRDKIIDSMIALTILKLSIETAIVIFNKLGVLHLDISVENILVLYKEESSSIEAIKLIDWGLSVSESFTIEKQSYKFYMTHFLNKMCNVFLDFEGMLSDLNDTIKYKVFDNRSTVEFYRRVISLIDMKLKLMQYRREDKQYPDTHAHNNVNLDRLYNGIPTYDSDDLISLLQDITSHLLSIRSISIKHKKEEKLKAYRNIITVLEEAKKYNTYISKDVRKNILLKIISISLVNSGFSVRHQTDTGIYILNLINNTESLKSLICGSFSEHLRYDDLVRLTDFKQPTDQKTFFTHQRI
jgi:hypothetical protein